MVREGIVVRLLCAVLGVSRSGYYAWLSRPESERKKQNDELIKEIKKIHDDSRKTYGFPRINAKLKSLGRSCGKTRVLKLMKIAGISAKKRSKYVVKTTDSNHSSPISDRIFMTEEPVTHPVKPNSVWASDITYIHTGEGFLYLATYLDLFTRKIVGFATDEHMETSLLLRALDMALGRQCVEPGELLHHSDRGSQYASEALRKRLATLQITTSMSRKGNCYDNAYAESFFATIKKELIYRNDFKTKAEAKKAIFEFIEVWYNRKRIHSSIGYMTPVQFEASLAA
jgi:transposase InsO family protein